MNSIGLGTMPVTVLAAGQGKAVVRVLPMGLYDTELTGTNSITSLDFYRNLVGQNYGNVATKKTDADTNLKSQGMVSKGQAFEILGFNIHVQGTTVGTSVTQIDFERVYSGSMFQFFIGNNLYAQIPMMEIPEGVGPWANFVGNGNTTASTVMNWRNGVPSSKEFYPYWVTVGGKSFKIQLVENEQFSAKIVWPNAVSFTASTKLVLCLRGIYSVGV